MHAFISTIHFPSLVFFPIFISFLSSFFVYSFVFYSLLSFYFSSVCPPFIVHNYPFYTICNCRIHHFFPSTAFASLWVSLQDCPLAYWLPNHYLCSKCVGCTTLHSQTKLLVLFLTSLCFCFTHLNKD